jgi:ribosomal protein S18 acetylase RimI-like enzyme
MMIGIIERMRKRDISIRPMRPEDIEDVREVGQLTWSDLAMQDIGRRFHYPKRSEKLISSYMRHDPEGCLVAELDGKIIGSAFCHVWGGVGWIGPLEVHPNHQNAGVGRALLSACERYLESRGCKVIGLETMTHMPKHVHFYLSSGYTPTAVMLILEKILHGHEVPTQFVEEVTASTLRSVLNGIGDLSKRLSPVLDYTVEARRAVEDKLGSLFVVKREGTIAGFAILHTYQKGEESRFSSIKALLSDPDVEDLELFDALLARCEQASLSAGKDHILLRMSASSPEIYQHMLSRGYSLKAVNVRMVKKGRYDEKGLYHATSWAG